jgi:hypothetical protein
LASDAVKAKASSTGFEIVVVLDRDHEREPGLTHATFDHAVETQIVWSRHSLESLFMEVDLLSIWLRGLLGPESPADLSSRVEAALTAANAEGALNEGAREQLTANLLSSDLRADKGQALAGPVLRHRRSPGIPQGNRI